MIVSRPVPNKALKVVCKIVYYLLYFFICYLKLVLIPQLYNGWTLPPGIGSEYFFTKEVKGELFAIKSIIKPNLAITVLSDGFVNVTQFVSSYNQLFCECPVSDTYNTA